MAESAAAELGFRHRLVMPADWGKYHRAAGPIRNKAMLAVLLQGKASAVCQVWAFHDNLSQSKGTANMVRTACSAGVRVRVFRHKERT